MKRVYVDLHLCSDFGGLEQASAMVRKAAALGFRVVGVSLPLNFSSEDVSRLRSVGKDVGVDVVSRVDLRPRTSAELLRDLRRLRRRFEVVAVLCECKAVARQAAKDRRVDLLNFPSVDFRGRFFDRAEGELASHGLVAFEIDVRSLLVLDGVARIRFLSSLRREVGVARDFGVPVVVSSGVSDVFLLRGPRELAALGGLFDLDKVLAVEAVSGVPLAIVKRNREKLGVGFVAPGVRVVRRGRDCEGD